MANMKDRWVELVTQLALRPDPDRMISSGIKYFRDIAFSISGEEWNNGFPVSLADLAYEGRSTKMAQLSRNYLNKPSLEAARNKLIERTKKKADYSSVMVSMQAMDKDGRSQGHCLAYTIVTHNPKNYTTGKPEVFVDVYYRVTEVIKKFGADLIFLHDVVIPQILVEPYFLPEDITKVTFHFSNIYFSPLFLPIMVPQMDVIKLMYDISDTQPKEALRGCYNALWNITVDPEHYSYRTRRKMCCFLQKKTAENKYLYLDLLNNLAQKHNFLKEIT